MSLEEIQDDGLDAEMLAMRPKWHPVDFFGLVTGIIPFFLSYTKTTTESLSVTSAGAEISSRTVTHVDYVALACGAGTIVCALVVLATRGRMRSVGARFFVFAALLALGGLQLVRGVLATMGGIGR